MKTKLTDTLDYSKTLDFNHHDLVVDNIAIFTAHPLFCCCSCVVSGRRTFFRVKVRQAPTPYLLVHLTNSTTLTAYIQWYSNRRFRNFLLFTSSEDPLLSYPTHCRRAAVSRIPVVSLSCPTARTPSRHSSNNDFVSSNYTVRLTAYENCTTISVPLPTSLLVVVYFGRDVSTTVTFVVKCSMLTLLQPLPHVPSTPQAFGFDFRQKQLKMRVACEPHLILIHYSKPTPPNQRPQGMHNILPPPFMRYPAINLLISSSLTTASKKYLDVTFISLK